MSLGMILLYAAVLWIVARCWKAFQFIFYLTVNESRAYEMAEYNGPPQCDNCMDVQYVERLGNGDLMFCQDCALAAPVRAWELVSIHV